MQRASHYNTGHPPPTACARYSEPSGKYSLHVDISQLIASRTLAVFGGAFADKAEAKTLEDWHVACFLDRVERELRYALAQCFLSKKCNQGPRHPFALMIRMHPQAEVEILWFGDVAKRAHDIFAFYSNNPVDIGRRPRSFGRAGAGTVNLPQHSCGSTHNGGYRRHVRFNCIPDHHLHGCHQDYRPMRSLPYQSCIVNNLVANKRRRCRPC